jgi:hypothetical protein
MRKERNPMNEKDTARYEQHLKMLGLDEETRDALRDDGIAFYPACDSYQTPNGWQDGKYWDGITFINYYGLFQNTVGCYDGKWEDKSHRAWHCTDFRVTNEPPEIQRRRLQQVLDSVIPRPSVKNEPDSHQYPDYFDTEDESDDQQ